jgi:hypothetical protein
MMISQAQQECATLCFLDFKTVKAYNNTFYRVVVQLRLCGQIVYISYNNLTDLFTKFLLTVTFKRYVLGI